MCGAGTGSGVECNMSDAEMRKVAERTAGFSAAELSDIISEACQRCVRDAVSQAQTSNPPDPTLRSLTFQDLKVGFRLS